MTKKYYVITTESGNFGFRKFDDYGCAIWEGPGNGISCGRKFTKTEALKLLKRLNTKERLNDALSIGKAVLHETNVNE